MSRSSLCCAFLALAVPVSLAGCGDGGDYTDYDSAAPGDTTAAHDHDHDHGHDHHDHPEHGPHGGHLIELDEHEHHAELVYDAKTKMVTVYMFGHDFDEPLPIEAQDLTLTLLINDEPHPLTLPAVPQEGEAEGKSSRFQADLTEEQAVVTHVKDAEDLHGTLTVTIEGEELTGEITHDHGHDHDHDHDHGHGEEKKPAKTE